MRKMDRFCKLYSSVDSWPPTNQGDSTSDPQNLLIFNWSESGTLALTLVWQRTICLKRKKIGKTYPMIVLIGVRERDLQRIHICAPEGGTDIRNWSRIRRWYSRPQGYEFMTGHVLIPRSGASSNALNRVSSLTILGCLTPPPSIFFFWQIIFFFDNYCVVRHNSNNGRRAERMSPMNSCMN